MANRRARANRTSSESWLAEREAVRRAAQTMHREGLVVETSGNVSARVRGEGADSGKGDLIAITASGTAYESMTVDDIVVVDHEGEPVLGSAVPSSELLMHVAIYRARSDVGAVMHTHSTYASALAVAGLAIPPLIDEMVISLGESIQVSTYAYPSSEEMGEAVVAALGEHNAALIKNHGFVGVGHDVRTALKACRLGEQMAQIFVLARQMGNPDPLPASAVQAEVELFRMRQESGG